MCECQRLEHAAINCNPLYRCVKCNKNHDPSKCEASATNHKNLFCTNCNTFGHPASYRGCLKLIKIKNKIEIKHKYTKLKDRTKKIKHIASYIQPNISYANMTKNMQYSQ